MKYKVILPVDLGDGKILRPGDTVEINDPNVAKEYAHALHRVEDKTTEAAQPGPQPAATVHPAGIVEGVRKPNG